MDGLRKPRCVCKKGRMMFFRAITYQERIDYILELIRQLETDMLNEEEALLHNQDTIDSARKSLRELVFHG